MPGMTPSVMTRPSSSDEREAHAALLQQPGDLHRAALAAHLLVVRRTRVHGLARLEARGQQHLHRLQLRDQVALVVPGAAAPDEAVLDRARERAGLPLALGARRRSAPRPGGPAAASAWPADRCPARCTAGCSSPTVSRFSCACTRGNRSRSSACSLRNSAALASGSSRLAMVCRRTACASVSATAFSSTASGGAAATSSWREPWRTRVDGQHGRQQQQQAERWRGRCA